MHNRVMLSEIVCSDDAKENEDRSEDVISIEGFMKEYNAGDD